MARVLPLALLTTGVGLLALGGCKPSTADVGEASANSPGANSAAATNGSSDGVRPYTPGSAAVGGGVVQGGESVDGAGAGGVGQAAKNKARSVAGSAGAPAGMGASGGESADQ